MSEQANNVALLCVEIGWPAKELGSNSRVWTDARNDQLRALHGTMTIHEVAKAMGTSPGAIRAQVTKLGISKKPAGWTDADIELLRNAYENATCSEEVAIETLVQKLGRNKIAIQLKASRLGLTDVHHPLKCKRKDRRKYGDMAAFRAVHSQVAKAAIAKHGHNRGMLGKKHSAEVKERLAQTTRAWWESLGEQGRLAHTAKAVRTRIANAGGPPQVARASWKAGWREIGGKRHYFRSRWEANYARWLQWLKERGEIADWEFEPHVFWFEKIQRGVRSYKPDFRVTGGTESDAVSWHEVKGWMDDRSRICLKRMAKYHPDEIILLVEEPRMRLIAKGWAAAIDGWEYDPRGRP